MNKTSESEIGRRHPEATADESHYVTLRVNNFRLMKGFYQHFLGFELLGEFPSAALLRVAIRPGTRIQMLGLLQRSSQAGPERDMVRHLAFYMPGPDHELERKRLETLGLRVDAKKHGRRGERSLCFCDPEGNEVEWIWRAPEPRAKGFSGFRRS